MEINYITDRYWLPHFIVTYLLLGSLVVRVLESRLDGREFDFRPPGLVFGWLTVFGRAGKPPQYFTKPPRPTQPPTLSGTGNEYQPKCGDAGRRG